MFILSGILLLRVMLKTMRDIGKVVGVLIRNRVFKAQICLKTFF